MGKLGNIVSGNIVSLGFLTLLNCAESTDITLKITTRQCGNTTDGAFRIAHDHNAIRGKQWFEINSFLYKQIRSVASLTCFRLGCSFRSSKHLQLIRKISIYFTGSLIHKTINIQIVPVLLSL